MLTLAWMNTVNSKWVLKYNCRHGKAFCFMMHRNRKSATSMIANNALQYSIIDLGHITLCATYHHRNFQDVSTKIRSSDLNFSFRRTLKRKTVHYLSYTYTYLNSNNLDMHLKTSLFTYINKIISSILKLINNTRHIHFGYNFIAVFGILRYLYQCLLFSSASVHSTDGSYKLLLIQMNGKERIK